MKICPTKLVTNLRALKPLNDPFYNILHEIVHKDTAGEIDFSLFSAEDIRVALELIIYFDNEPEEMEDNFWPCRHPILDWLQVGEIHHNSIDMKGVGPDVYFI